MHFLSLKWGADSSCYRLSEEDVTCLFFFFQSRRQLFVIIIKKVLRRFHSTRVDYVRNKTVIAINCFPIVTIIAIISIIDRLVLSYSTRRERLKSALYLRLKKRKTFFLEKNLKFSKKNSFGKCRTVPKNVKEGTLFDL